MVILLLEEINKIIPYLKLTGILIIPVFLYLIPLDNIDNHHSLCLFKNIFHGECYGCGITRALLNALHFNFEIAFNYNKLWIIVLPLLLFLWIKLIINAIKIIRN